MAKVYTHAVKAGGRIFAAGAPVEVTPKTDGTAAAVTSTITRTVDAAVDTIDTADTINPEDVYTLNFNKLKKAELEDLAEKRGISLDGLSTKAEYVTAITAALEVSE